MSEENLVGLSEQPLERRAVLAGIVTTPLIVGSALAAGQAEAISRGLAIYERSFAAFDGKTLEQKVQILTDRAEIQELVHRYAHLVAHDLTVAQLFTDDGAFISHQPATAINGVRGRAKLDEFYAGLATGTTHPKPMIHNHLIEIRGDEAEGICSLEVRQSIDGESIIGSGWYEDSYRRVGGRWKFVVRDLRFFHYVPLQKGWAN